MKIRQTPRQRANTLDALHNMWPSVPKANVFPDLWNWSNDIALTDNDFKHTCETVACFGGWCSAWPNFRAQGVKTEDDGAPYMRDARGYVNSFDVAEILFGDESLFSVRGEHPADGSFDGSDHKLVTRRLKWLLKNSEVVT